MICHTDTNRRVGLRSPAVPVRTVVGLDPGLLSAETSFDECRQSLSLLISNFEEIASTRPGESMASAPRQEPWLPAPPSGVDDVDDKLSYPRFFPCNSLFFCLAKFEQGNDRVGVRYIRHWLQLAEPSKFLRLLPFRCSRFYHGPTEAEATRG